MIAVGSGQAQGAYMHAADIGRGSQALRKQTTYEYKRFHIYAGTYKHTTVSLRWDDYFFLMSMTAGHSHDDTTQAIRIAAHKLLREGYTVESNYCCGTPSAAVGAAIEYKPPSPVAFSLNQPMSIIDFATARAERAQRRIDCILAVMELDLPKDLVEEEGTGDLVATPEQWQYFEAVFSAFSLELPKNLSAKAAIAASVYLAGHLGADIKLRTINPTAFAKVSSLLTDLERSFIQTLWDDDVTKARELAVQLRVLDKRMSDFTG